jgi:DNA-binding LacI/PurR family transcriptional regulator
VRTTAGQRTEGFLSAIGDEGINIHPSYVRESDYSIEGGYEHLRGLLELDPRPTAVFIANNFMTVGALRAIYEAGLEVPDEISVLGFDDMYWYTITRPSLSAVSQPAYDMGRVAAERILTRLDGEEQPPPERLELKTELIVRESTAPPLRAKE